MFDKIILASKSQVRKKILEENGIKCIVEPSNIDEDLIKESLLKEYATPKLISKNLAELKANKISQKKNGNLVLGADSVINLNEEIINVNGGAVALGHPLGMTGAKLSIKLINEMKRRNQKYGIVTACVGGGQGVCGVFENL